MPFPTNRSVLTLFLPLSPICRLLYLLNAFCSCRALFPRKFQISRHLSLRAQNLLFLFFRFLSCVPLFCPLQQAKVSVFVFLPQEPLSCQLFGQRFAVKFQCRKLDNAEFQFWNTAASNSRIFL